MSLMQKFSFRSNKRWLSLSLLAGLMIIVAASLLLIGGSKENIEVHLVVDGEELSVKTEASDVAQLIEFEQIGLGEYDHISKPLTAKLEDGDQIEIEHAKAIQLIDHGQLYVRYTTAETVEEALFDWGITLNPNDEIHPNLEDSIEEHGAIKIDRISFTYEKEIEEIPYSTEEQLSPQLLKGKKNIERYGKPGEKERVFERVWRNGILESEELVAEKVVTESVNQLVSVGTKSEVRTLSASSQNIDQVTKDGITFGVKSIFENVILTAYDAGVNSTGKTKDHPQYGITYTGTTVQAGRTVAVDPDVIPLGWWIYIEGYGFRKAEDIGGAVKGKKVDIYVETEAEANQFGLKRGYTVYVIGPEKPAGL